jgi:hypothetical protein
MSILRVINLITPHKKHIHLLGGLTLISPTFRRRKQGLQRGSRGIFLPDAMVVVIAVGLGWWLTSEPLYNMILRNSTYYSVP